jgi:hypothetical protein
VLKLLLSIPTLPDDVVNVGCRLLLADDGPRVSEVSRASRSRREPVAADADPGMLLALRATRGRMRVLNVPEKKKQSVRVDTRFLHNFVFNIYVLWLQLVSNRLSWPLEAF